MWVSILSFNSPFPFNGTFVSLPCLKKQLYESRAVSLVYLFILNIYETKVNVDEICFYFLLLLLK